MVAAGVRVVDVVVVVCDTCDCSVGVTDVGVDVVSGFD